MILNKLPLICIVLTVVCCFVSCKESIISPTNQQVAFVKYFGHVADQTSHDLKKTSDGGYIMIGSTNSFTTEEEHDVYVVKTDALGNELWSTSIGKSASGGTINYDEVGVSVEIMPEEAGYLIACNRTYVQYSTAGDPPAPLYTKIVLYQLDIAGVNMNGVDGIELESNTLLSAQLPNAGSVSSERVSDMLIDTFGGAISFVLTGYTNNISIGKPDPYNRTYDLTDIFTIRLNESFVQLWASGNLNYGFNGRDYGTSIQVVNDDNPFTEPWYVVVGTSENEWEILSEEFTFRNIAVKLNKSSGSPTNPTYYGDVTRSFEDGHSVLNNENNHITVAATCISGNEIGQIVLFEIDENLTEVQSFKFYAPADLNFMGIADDDTYHAESIDILPESKGYIVSMNHKKTNDKEHDICIMKVDNNLAREWSKFFGYNNAQSSFSTIENAGSVIAVTEQIEGTNTPRLSGYAFTGTFGMATNEMMGLVKLNAEGGQ
jgi:hypothetical protein